MFLTEEYEKLVHLIAQAFAKAHGSETPGTFADTVLEHAKALAEPVLEAVEPAAEPVAEPGLTPAAAAEATPPAPAAAEPVAPIEHTGE